jgi:hypothetical protein
MNQDLYKKLYTILEETFEELQDEYLHALIDVALDKIEDVIDGIIQENTALKEALIKNNAVKEIHADSDYLVIKSIKEDTPNAK